VVGETQSDAFIRGCIGFALGAATGLLTSDLWFRSTMEASGVAPPHTFHVGYWIFFAGLVGVATFVHGVGRLVLRSRSGAVAAALTGLLSALPLHLPRDAAYEAMCAPICSGRQDAWIYVLVVAFAGGLLNRAWLRKAAPANDAPAFSNSFGTWVSVLLLLAILALPTWILVYHAWYERISVQQYSECLSLRVPTTLGILEERFGPGRRLQVVDYGEFSGYVDYDFEPNPDYSFAWSSDMSARVVPGKETVVDLFCGEGW
jgi:hypothetical protein